MGKKIKKVLLLGSGALKIGTGTLLSKIINILKTNYRFVKNNVLHFWKMPKTTRFTLKEPYFKELVLRSGLNLKELSQKLGVSYSFLVHLKNGKYSIPIEKLIKLKELSNVSLNEIEKNLQSVRTRHGHVLHIKFPMQSSKEIASLVGNIFGDGTVSSNSREVEYSNTNPLLIENFEKTILCVFNCKPITKTTDRLTYSSIIGDILLCFGAPIAPKIQNKLRAPDWIKSNKEYSQAFLRSIFDDDGSVMYSDNFAAKGVNLYQTRPELLVENLSALLSDVQFMLSKFGISCSEPKISRFENYEDGNHVVMYINITDFGNIEKFYDMVGLEKGSKQEKLELIINKIPRYSKSKEKELIGEIKNVFNNKRVLSTAEIADVVKLKKTSVLKKLKKLEQEQFIKRIGKVAVNRSIIWKQAGVNYVQ